MNPRIKHDPKLERHMKDMLDIFMTTISVARNQLYPNDDDEGFDFAMNSVINLVGNFVFNHTQKRR